MTIGKKYAKYVSQNILGMLGISLYILADTFFISMAKGADGITALNLVLPLYSIIYALGAMIGVGAAIRFAIMKAKGEESADFRFFNAFFFACVISIPFMLAGILIPDKIMTFMGADAAIVAVGTPYTRIFMMFTPFFMLNYVFTSFVRNDGDPGLAMAATLSSSLFNIVFDYILMFPCQMGMAGAALATAISPILGIAICVSHFWKKTNTIRIKLQRPSFRTCLSDCKLGISAFIGELSSGVTTMVFNMIILRIAGNVGVAAYGVVANTSLVAISIFNGVANGSQPLLSEFYGKGKLRDVSKVLRLSIATALVIAIVILAGILAFAEPIVDIFNGEKSIELANYGVPGMRLYFLGFLVAGINIAITGYFSATDKPKEAFVASILRGVLAIIICAIVMASLWGMYGVWLSFGAAEVITLVLNVILFRRRKKRS